MCAARPPQLRGCCSSNGSYHPPLGTKTFGRAQIYKAQVMYLIPLLQAGALGCPVRGDLMELSKQFPKDRIKMLVVENLGDT